MPDPTLELPNLVDVWLKQGADRTIPGTWLEGWEAHDFTGESARLLIYDECGRLRFTLTQAGSSYGSVYLGTPATADQGSYSRTFSKALTQALRAPKSHYDFYIDHANGESTCLLSGVICLKRGAPF